MPASPPPHPGTRGMGRGSWWAGRARGEGGTREAGRRGADEDRKPDTVCVIKLQPPRSAVQEVAGACRQATAVALQTKASEGQ